MKTITTLLLLVLPSIALAQTTQQVIRNPNGQIIGRTVTDPRGNSTFYDPMGRNVGRSTTNNSGTTFYDSSGRQTGRSSRR